MANVSVTPINMGDDQQQQQSTRICAVTSTTASKEKSSYIGGTITVNNTSAACAEDAEVAHIIQQQHHEVDAAAAAAAGTVTVALRCKGKQQLHASLSSASAMASQHQLPRPMSWEGELSSDDNRSNDICMMAMDEDSCCSSTNSNDDLATVDGFNVNATLPNSSQQVQQIALILPENLATTVMQHQTTQRPTTDSSTTTKLQLVIQQTQQQQTSGADSKQQHQDNKPTPSQSPLLSSHRGGGGGGGCCLPGHSHQGAAVQLSSPDSAIHSASTCYSSVFSSPTQSPLLSQRHINALQMMNAVAATTTPNLSRNNSDASHSSCCSYSSVSCVSSECNLSSSSPTHSTGSPIQLRHCPLVRSAAGASNSFLTSAYPQDPLQIEQQSQDTTSSTPSATAAVGHISRQQLINSPCPICGDKISGFHYGIFSCESCKGFFKRTVQNRKNYVCLRGAVCPVTVATRKKCPACRFEKCLQCGMKLEAIREDRTRGGRSTYQCSYSLPPSMLSSMTQSAQSATSASDIIKQEVGGSSCMLNAHAHQSVLNSGMVSQQHQLSCLSRQQRFASRSMSSLVGVQMGVPPLLQEIMDVEHLWHYSELELNRLELNSSGGSGNNAGCNVSTHNLATHPLLAGTALTGMTDTNPDFVANLCNIADHRLYKIVKWCKSLPLFKNISIDDQILLLINSWCELLLFSCCYRSMSTPGEIRVSLGKRITLAQARDMGPTSTACIERMLNFTEQLRRLRVDRYEYVAMKVIVLLTSDTSQSDLSEAEKVRASQEKALKALQDYTLTHYPDSPAKFGELLLRIPELQRTCQVGKEMLTIKSKDGDGPSFNLLMELLRGDH